MQPLFKIFIQHRHCCWPTFIILRREFFSCTPQTHYGLWPHFKFQTQSVTNLIIACLVNTINYLLPLFCCVIFSQLLERFLMTMSFLYLEWMKVETTVAINSAVILWFHHHHNLIRLSLAVESAQCSHFPHFLRTIRLNTDLSKLTASEEFLLIWDHA